MNLYNLQAKNPFVCNVNHFRASLSIPYGLLSPEARSERQSVVCALGAVAAAPAAAAAAAAERVAKEEAARSEAAEVERVQAEKAAKKARKAAKAAEKEKQAKRAAQEKAAAEERAAAVAASVAPSAPAAHSSRTVLEGLSQEQLVQRQAENPLIAAMRKKLAEAQRRGHGLDMDLRAHGFTGFA